MPTRILCENSSFKSKYSETMSRTRINMNMVSLFINKRKAAIQQPFPLAFYMLRDTILVGIS